ncbi:hypothetical protein M8J77_026084 [Diaphorina citri]|nr:hypothetical protein M8J77_026084 [Diaphorina citri]
MNSNSHPLLNQDDKDVEPKIFNKYKPFKQNEFDEIYHHTEYKKKHLSESLKNKLRSKFKIVNIVLSLFPILEWLPNYNWKNDLSHDMVSGFTVAVLHIPQGMAYSSLGGVPPIVGIYMAVFPVIIYMCMGTSRHISMGTFSVVCMMTSKAVYTYSDPRYFSSDSIQTNITSNSSLPSPHDPLGLSPVQVASAVCITVGIWHVILGMFQLGSLSVLMSDIMISGFTTGTAILVILSQIKHVFGIKVKRHIGPFNVIYTLIDVAENIHKTNYVAFGVVVILVSVLIIYNDYFKSKIQKNISFPIPTEMIVIVAGALLSSILDVKHKYNLSNVVVTGQKVMVYKLGRLIDSNIYVEEDFYESAIDVPGIVILRIIGGMNFINKDKVFHKISKLSLSSEPYPKQIILDMMSLSSVDTSTVKSFLDLYKELMEQGISLHIVKLLEPVKQVFVKCDFFNDFPSSQLYPTVYDAVSDCKEY